MIKQNFTKAKNRFLTTVSNFNGCIHKFVFCIAFIKQSPSFAAELTKSSFFNIDISTTLDDIAKSNEKKAYLTFDDGPTTKATSKILDVLKSEDVKATFFVVGKQEHLEGYQ